MPYPFLTDREHSPHRNRSDRTAGAVVILGDGKRLFFPGGTEALAAALANAVLTSDELTDPATRIEYGTAAGGSWVCEKVIKAGVPVTSGTNSI